MSLEGQQEFTNQRLVSTADFIHEPPLFPALKESAYFKLIGRACWASNSASRIPFMDFPNLQLEKADTNIMSGLIKLMIMI